MKYHHPTSCCRGQYGRHSQMIHPEATLTSASAIGTDFPRSSRDLGYRKVQGCAERGVVELSAHRGETGETEYTRRTLEGTPSLYFPRPKLTTECRFG